MNLTKTEFRFRMRSLLKVLTASEAERLSAILRDRLLPLLGAESHKNILLFAGLSGEPDLLSLAPTLRCQGHSLALPRMEGKEIIPIPWIGSPEGLRQGAFGIREPQGQDEGWKPDLVLVPGLAFTKDGLRLGRGGGHFDRYLARTKAEAWGICFACQVVEEIPVDPWDVRMDRVISESGS